MARLLCITAMLASDAALAARTTPRRLAKVGHVNLATLPVRMFKEDCKLKRPIAALVQNPGAGMDPTPGPYKEVLKDGYFHVECVKDSMFLHGDKYGDNKFSYKLGDISNVSVVHYAAGVAKEDRQPMSHDTCFAFCRTVPEMLFFGVTNGRECYCAPYYKPMASDSSNCDAVCEGDATTMCGGKTKSSIFEMHDCQSTEADLAEAGQKLVEASSALDAVAQSVRTIEDYMQSTGDELKKSYGQGGDVAAAGLMQQAVIFAGEMEVAVTKADKLKTKATELTTQEGTYKGANFQDISTTLGAEDLISQMEQLIAEAEAMTEELQTLEKQAVRATNTTTALSQYYETMYFVDNNQTYLPSTCGGDLAARPMIATPEECAAACDADRPESALLEIGTHSQTAKEGVNKMHSHKMSKVGGCVGFSMFETFCEWPGDSSKKGLCFLFSKHTSLRTYYCNKPDPSMLRLLQKSKLQTKVQPHATACMAKLQYFEGTTLAPDASGKCEKCLKNVTTAEWCSSDAPVTPADAKWCWDPSLLRF